MHMDTMELEPMAGSGMRYPYVKNISAFLLDHVSYSLCLD